MKNKSIIFFLTTVTIVSLILLLILFNYNSELENQISNKDNQISKSIERDSLLIQKTREYAETIEKYVNNCEFSIDGKKISPTEVVKLANKTMRENQKLKDSLNYFKLLSTQQSEVYPKEYNKLISKYRDSLEIYKWKSELVRKDFGIIYNIQRNGNKMTSKRNSKKIDSALALFPYYKHKLSIDKDGYFEIKTDKEYRRNKRNEEKNKQ
tara:strand:+ start:494 stop:1123 length:630 start_codon:yes stop_codon:yes gene_type:complete